MAYEIHGIINDAHELPILCCSYNTARKELYSGSQVSAMLTPLHKDILDKFVSIQLGPGLGDLLAYV